MRYLRAVAAGGTYFFTVNLAKRRSKVQQRRAGNQRMSSVKNRKAGCGNWRWQGLCEAKTRKTAHTVL